MAGRVTITDVAREAGVSVATVSKVINGRDGIAQGTAAHVRAVVQRLGYEQSIVARSLRSHQTHVIGVLVAEFEPFSTEILKGAGAALADTEYALLAYTGGGSGRAGWERRYLTRLSGTLIDGAVLVTPTLLDPDGDIPVVAVDPHAGPGGLPTVDSENLNGALLATRHLIGLGHRRIGFLGGRADLESSRLREAGYRQALAEAGIATDPALVRVAEYQRDGADRPTAALLALPDPPTALFAANDLSAMGILDTARRLGVRVPEDLSVVGFDDIPESAATDPPLTTVRQDLRRLGGAAVELLLRMLDGTDPHPDHVRLPTTLILRASTARRDRPAPTA
ncbi:MAG TPA: LacI family DNA-binding transcriptional regulator [Cellulomonas sp.]